MSDFNIQFCDSTGFVIDPNVNFYAEEDASEAQVWDEDNCIATLISDGDKWLVERVDPFYAVNDESIESDEYDTVADFVERLTKVLEKV